MLVMDHDTDEISTEKILFYSFVIGGLLVALMWIGRAVFKWSYRGALFTVLLWFLVFTVIIWLLYYSVEPSWVLSSSGSLDYRKTLWWAVITTSVVMNIALCVRILVYQTKDVSNKKVDTHLV